MIATNAPCPRLRRLSAVAVLAGEAIHRHRERLPRLGPLLPTAAVVAAGIQLVGWLSAAHRYAVGRDGPLWFFPASQVVAPAVGCRPSP